MAGVEKISIPQLGGENWSIWKAKFQALMEYKGLFVAIEQPESAEGRKASGQAKALMILHTQDAFVKLIVGEPTAAKAWEKLKRNLEKTSNARVGQLMDKLTTMRLREKQSIAEYLGEFREIKIDLEATGQTVSDLQLVVHALRGLPKGYETLREILEAGDDELSLDTVQPKLMQREQALQARSKAPQAENGDVELASAYVAKQRSYPSSGNSRGSSNELGRSSEVRGGSSNPPTCYCCGNTGHKKASCRLRDAECRKCGRKGHMEVMCRQPTDARGGVEEQEVVKAAFTAWGDNEDVLGRVWIVDSGSTQHVTADRSQFTSYRKLVREEEIMGICGESLKEVGIGEVELKCKTPSGVS